VKDYAIISNRKRALIALAHSVVFLLIAMRGLATATAVSAIWLKAVPVSSLVMLFVYLIVSSVLIYLVRISRCSREKLYFAFCASSATLGLLRTVVGDPNFPASQYLRVLMLLCAVTTGTVILRTHSRMRFAEEAIPAPFSE